MSGMRLEGYRKSTDVRGRVRGAGADGGGGGSPGHLTYTWYLSNLQYVRARGLGAKEGEVSN
jgi:hypothetical protein